jgi:hypothetical protein
MYSRRVLAGEFTVVNKYLLRDLIDRGLWTAEVRNQIMGDGGSVQNVACVPKDLKVCQSLSTLWTSEAKVHADSLSRTRGSGAVQDGVGDQAEDRDRPSCGPWGVHLPVSVAEHPPCQPNDRPAYVHALLRLEEGAQDRSAFFSAFRNHYLFYYLKELS